MIKVGWIRVGWIRVGWIRLGWLRVGWIRVGWINVGWIRVGWIRVGWISVGWIRVGLGSIYGEVGLLIVRIIGELLQYSRAVNSKKIANFAKTYCIFVFLSFWVWQMNRWKNFAVYGSMQQ